MLDSSTTSPSVDLNADAGESFGSWRKGSDEALIPHLSSINVACGAHAGDPSTMRTTVRHALQHGVAIGAHPGYPDLEGFGRREMSMTSHELADHVMTQLGALDAIARSEGATLRHVKPHGAMHHRMVHDDEAADAVAAAIAAFNPNLIFFGLAGPAGEVMCQAAERHGLRLVVEAFPDRGYLADGRLAPRSLSGAVIDDPNRIAERAVQVVTTGQLGTLDGGTLTLRPRTLCLHGDGPTVVEAAAALRAALHREGVTVQAP